MAGLMFFVGCAGPFLKKEQVELEDKKHKGITTSHEVEGKDDFKLQGKFYNRFTVYENGELKFNPWGLLAPAQVELGYETGEEKKATFDLPYEYSRFFNSAQSLDSESRQKVLDYIEQEIKNKIAEDILFLDFTNNTKKVYEAKHLEGRNKLFAQDSLNVSKIRITGFASPEGPQERGPQTIVPGEVDEKNIALGEKRALDMFPFVKAALEKHGLQIDSSLLSLSSEEIQFTDDEMRQLRDMAVKVNIEGADDLEKIHNLIIHYNDDKFIENEEIQSQLNELVGSKRKVNIEIEFANKEIRKAVIPIPIFVIWPFLQKLFRRRRRQGQPKTDQPVIKEAPSISEDQPDLVPPRTDITNIKPSDEIYDKYGQGITKEEVDLWRKQYEVDKVFVTRYKKALDELSPAEIERREEETIINDIYTFIDDPKTISRGIDYRDLAKHYAVAAEYLPEEERDIGLTHRVLKVWAEHDKKLRQEIGINTDEGLDYINNEEQIRWAYIHAKELQILAEAYKKEGDEGINKTLVERFKLLAGRQALRGRDKFESI